MGKARPIIIGEKHFATQRKAEHAVRECIKSIGPASTIHHHQRHFSFFKSLLERHRRKMDEIDGREIVCFSISPNSMTKSLELSVTLDDKSAIVFSWLKCISDHDNQLYSAMRTSIESQVSSFRDRHLTPDAACGVCKVPLARTNVHVDHCIPQFIHLVKDFLDNAPVSAPSAFDDRASNMRAFKASDVAFERAWQGYHQKTAQLRLLCSNCNLTRKRKST